MIVDALIGLLLTVISGVFSLVPAYSLPGSMSDFGASVGSWVSTANGFFPVVALGACLAILLVAQVFVLAYRVLVFVYDVIPLKFT